MDKSKASLVKVEFKGNFKGTIEKNHAIIKRIKVG